MEKKRNNNDYKRNRVLFDFESIVDLKLSAIKKYLIESGKAIIEDSQMNPFKFNRMYVYQDPLSLIGMKGKEDDLNLDHPEAPVFTGMKHLAEVYYNDPNKLIDPTVLCKDQFQQLIIKKSIPGIKTLVSTRKRIKTINFSRIVIAEPKHALDFTDPITVDFMVLNYRENFSENDMTLIDEKILIAICDVNKFTIAKAYPEIPDPEG